MARRRAHLQNAFSKGELDPLLYARTDLKHYYNAVETALNVEMLPQGGFRRRPGSATLGRLRRQLSAIALTGGMLAAPNGGTAGNLIDGTSAALVTGAVGSTPYVVATVDLGAPQPVCAVDVLGFSAQGDTDAVAVTLNADTSGAGTLRQRIAAAQIAAGGAQVRLVLAPPSAGNSTQIVDCFIGEAAPGGGANFVRTPTRVTFGGLRGVTLPPGGTVLSDIIDYQLDATKDLIVSFNLDTGSGVRLSGSATGFTVYLGSGEEAGEVQVSGYNSLNNDARILTRIEVDFFSAADSVTVQYEDTPGVWVSLGARRDIGVAARSGRFGAAPGTPPVSKQKWRVAAIGATGAASITVQELRFWSETNALSPCRFLPFARSLADVYAAPLTAGHVDFFGLSDTWLGAVGVAAPADRVRAMGWLQSDDAGLLLHQEHQPQRIVRQGADDQWHWDLPIFANVPDLAAPMAYAAGARPLLMSPASGWPGCGALVQSRLVLGGFKTFQKTWAASRTGALFDFQLPTNPVLATDAIVYTLNTDQVERIRHIAVGTHLTFFTDTGEWYAENRLLNAGEATNMVRPTGNGSMAGVAPIMAEGGLVFLQAGSDDPDAPPEAQGSVLRHFVFGGDASQASYSAEPLSLLGSHLLTGVIDLAWRRGRKTDEGGLLYMPNADGTMAVMTFLAAQEVVSLAKHTGDGAVRAVHVDARRRVHLAVERIIGSQADNWLEQRDAGRLLDASVIRSLGATNVVTGLAHLEGRTNVWAIAGGNPYGPCTVTGGQATIPGLSASFIGTAEVGLFFPVTVRTLPLRPQLPDGEQFRPPGRCFKLVVSVVKTGGFAVSANGGAPRTVVCRDPAAGLTDVPMLQALYTGDVTIEDLEGWTSDVAVEITQPSPAPLTVRSLRMEVAY